MQWIWLKSALIQSISTAHSYTHTHIQTLLMTSDDLQFRKNERIKLNVKHITFAYGKLPHAILIRLHKNLSSATWFNYDCSHIAAWNCSDTSIACNVSTDVSTDVSSARYD